MTKTSYASETEEYQSLIRKKLRLRRAREARVEQNPLKYYWPHTLGCDGTQCETVVQECVDSYGEKYTIKGCPQYFFHISDADVKCYFGANRGGKTTAAIVELAFAATGLYPDWYPVKRRYQRPTRGRILAEDFKKAVGEVIIPKLFEWLPPSLIIDKQKNSQGIYDKFAIRHVSGGVSVFDIVTYEQRSEVCEGWNGDYAIFDEPPPKPHYIATARGLIDLMGWAVFTLTPLKEPWIFDDLWTPGNKREAT